MPVGKILPYHALKTLTQLHAELGGKIDSNQKSGDKLRAQMMQVRRGRRRRVARRIEVPSPSLSLPFWAIV